MLVPPPACRREMSFEICIRRDARCGFTNTCASLSNATTPSTSVGDSTSAVTRAKESARVTAEVLSPTDVLGVVACDSEAQVFVKPQRASRRMQISNDISRLQAGGGTNIYPGLREAFDLL